MTDGKEAKYKVGMIGIGRKGAQHAGAYRLDPRTHIVAAADTDEENLDIFCKRFGVRGYTDYKEMLAKEDIDIAAPILPVRPNPGVVIGCAESGVKGILCEKPFAATLEEADRAVNVCKANGVKVGAGDLDLNLPAYQKAKEMVDAGEIGDVLSIQYNDGSGTELSGGFIQRFSIIRMFANWAEIAWCIGWTTDDAWKDHDQGGAGYFRFVNGIEAFMSRDDDARGRGFVVNGTHGVLRNSNDVMRMYKSPATGVSSWETLQEVTGVFPEGSIRGREGTTPGNRDIIYEPDGWQWPGNRQVGSVKVFVDYLEQGLDPPGSGDNGRKVLEMAIGIRESHRRGHTAVQFPLEDRSLRMIPHQGRMEYKKPQMGRDAYMDQMAKRVKDDLVKL